MTQQKYLILSSLLNYQLSGTPVNWRAVLALMLGDGQENLPEDPLLDTLIFLGEAIGQKKRRLGPFAILHPIRTAALYLKADSNPDLLNALTALLHDKDEDLAGEESWYMVKHGYDEFLSRISKKERWLLNERVYHLTRKNNESFRQYLERLITQSKITPELLNIKLADRLDNTFDLRIDMEQHTLDIDCFQVIFEAVFRPNYRGISAKNPHPIARRINGAKRLYQLYKGAMLLSLITSNNVHLDKTGTCLFNSLAVTAINEAKSTLLHLFMYHLQDPGKQHEMILSTMPEYGHSGSGIKYGNNGLILDSLAEKYFAHEKKKDLEEKLSHLYMNKMAMGETALLLISLFLDLMAKDTTVV